MASSLFGGQQSPMQNNPMAMIQKFAEFKKTISGRNPEAMVRNLMSSGRMSQEQFAQYSQMAQQLQSILK